MRSFWDVYGRFVYRLLYGIDRDVSTCPLVVLSGDDVDLQRGIISSTVVASVTPTLLMLTRNVFVIGSVSNCSLSDPLCYCSAAVTSDHGRPRFWVLFSTICISIECLG